MRKSLLKSAILMPFILSTAISSGFIGAEYGYSVPNKIEFEVVAQGERSTIKSSKSSLNLGFKTGYIFKGDGSDVRVYAGYENKSKLKVNYVEKYGNDIYEFNFGAKTKNITINADWMPKLSQNLSMALGLYGGVSYMKYSFKDPDPNSQIVNLKNRGIIFGARVATIAKVGENHEIEFGVKLQNIRYKTNNAFVEQETYTIKPSQRGGELYIGYNYKF